MGASNSARSGSSAPSASRTRDTTRVAAGDPGLWTGIFAQNRPALLDALTALTERLDRFRQALQAGDRAAVDALLAEGKKVRDALGS